MKVEGNVEGNLRAIFENLEGIPSTETVFGEPIRTDKTTIIPVNTVSFGMGTAGGTGKADEGEGGGGGAGVGAKLTPRAVIAITEGEVNVFTIGDKAGVGGLIERVPELVNSLMGRFGGEKKGKGGMGKQLQDDELPEATQPETELEEQ
jgi:uncharacterized spore protein YtfJ